MKRLRGSFTVEAAVIVPLTMFIVVTFIYMAFYLHDKVVMSCTGADYILENAADYSGSLTDIEDNTEEMLESRLIIADSICVSVSEDDGVTLSSSAQVAMPFSFITDIMGSSVKEAESTVNISMLDGRRTLLKYKAIADGIDLLTGEE